MPHTKKYIRDYIRNRRHNDPEFKRRMNLAIKKYEEKLRAEILHLLGDKCCRCGFLDKRALQIDHVHGNGMKEIRSFHSRHAYYRYILEQIKAGSKDYQLLCANCNWIKRSENNE